MSGADGFGAMLMSSAQRAPWGWLLLVTAWGTLWRYGAPMAQVLVAYAEKIRSERRQDDDDCDRKIEALDKRVTAAEKASHHFEMKLVGALAAYRILDVEVARHIPLSTAREQAAAVLRDAFTLLPSTPNDVADAIDSGDPSKIL